MAEVEGLWFTGAARRCTTDDKRTPPHVVRDSGSLVLLVAFGSPSLSSSFKVPTPSSFVRRIAFLSNRHEAQNSEVFGIYLVRPDGSGLQRVEVAKGVEGKRERLNHVCFNGDGEWLLFTANLGGVTAEPIGLPNQFQPYGDLPDNGGREDEDEIMVKKGF